MTTQKLTELSLLTATALIIFIVELRFPDIIPLPGVKLGLANIITVYAVYRFQAKEAVMMVMIRVFLGAVFAGNISALIYSLSGAMLCLLGMLLIRKIIPIQMIWLCSIIGAILHNIGQISAAVLMMRTSAVIAYLPILIVSGCIAGLVTGLCAQLIVKRAMKEKIFLHE